MSSVKSNLNYFFALFLVGSAFALARIAPPLRRLIMSLGGDMNAYSMVNYITPLLVFAIIALLWWKKGALYPSPANPKALFWLRIGNIAMIVANSAITISLLVSIVGYVLIRDFGLAIGFIIGAGLMLAVPLNLLGIICVESSRFLGRRRASPSQNYC